MPARPTPTTYVLLGLLALRPWSAYELANRPHGACGGSGGAPRRRLRRGPTPRDARFAVATTEENGAGRALLRDHRRRPRRPAGMADDHAAEPQPEVEGLMRLMFPTRRAPADPRRAREHPDDHGGVREAGRPNRRLLETGGPFRSGCTSSRSWRRSTSSRGPGGARRRSRRPRWRTGRARGRRAHPRHRGAAGAIVADLAEPNG